VATTATFVPLSEYLQTRYRPDCDYLDGELLERSVGEWAVTGCKCAEPLSLQSRKQWKSGGSGAAGPSESV